MKGEKMRKKELLKRKNCLPLTFYFSLMNRG
jgi:hypothetical protein